MESELLSYETADLAPGPLPVQLDLPAPQRVCGSGIAAHSIGTPFCVLDPVSLFRYQFPASQIGKTLKFKFCSVNKAGQRQQDISQVNEYAFTVTAPPPAPTFAVRAECMDPTVAEGDWHHLPDGPQQLRHCDRQFQFLLRWIRPAPDYILIGQPCAYRPFGKSGLHARDALNPGDYAAIGAEDRSLQHAHWRNAQHHARPAWNDGRGRR